MVSSQLLFILIITIMDYEKLHKDTIAKLQEMVNSGKITVETACGICADFVPESEDEVMIKFIKNQLFNIKKTITENYELDAKLTKAIDWLEKQGEQKHIPWYDLKKAKEAGYTVIKTEEFEAIQKPVEIKPHLPDGSIPYDRGFEEAQEYLSKRGFDIPWNDCDVYVDEKHITQTVANVLAWADEHPAKPVEWSEED